MKSVGEVMALGKNFEEVIQKAIRMCEIGKDGLVANMLISEGEYTSMTRQIENSKANP